MSRIDEIFATRRAAGSGTLMPFLVAGYPSLAATAEILAGLEGAGASVVEIGFPFSDPIADGPVIAAAMHEALHGGVTPAAIFEMVAAVRPTTNLGLVAMVSISIVERIGVATFVHDAVEAGIDGLIVPDCDLNACDDLLAAVDAHDLSFSPLISPTTTPDRLDQILEACRGFIYLLARVGLTGEQSGPPQIADRVAMIRARTDLPIAAGFGISTPDHVSATLASANAAIVGSAIVRRMGGGSDPAESATAFIAELAVGIDSAS